MSQLPQFRALRSQLQSITCKKCNKKHNSIIHEDVLEERGSSPGKQPCEDSTTTTTVVMNCIEIQRNPSVESQMSNKQPVSDTMNHNIATNVYCASHQGTRVQGFFRLQGFLYWIQIMRKGTIERCSIQDHNQPWLHLIWFEN